VLQGGLARQLRAPWIFPLLFAEQQNTQRGQEQYLDAVSAANQSQREIDARRLSSEERRAGAERATSLFQHGVPITNLMSALNGILSGDVSQLEGIDAQRAQQAAATILKTYGEAANQGAEGGIRMNTPGMVQRLSQIAGAPLASGPTSVDARLASANASGGNRYQITMNPPPGLEGRATIVASTRDPSPANISRIQEQINTTPGNIQTPQGGSASAVVPQGGTSPNQMTPQQTNGLRQLEQVAAQHGGRLGPRQRNADGTWSIQIEVGRERRRYRLLPNGQTMAE